MSLPQTSTWKECCHLPITFLLLLRGPVLLTLGLPFQILSISKLILQQLAKPQPLPSGTRYMS